MAHGPGRVGARSTLRAAILQTGTGSGEADSELEAMGDTDRTLPTLGRTPLGATASNLSYIDRMAGPGKHAAVTMEFAGHSVASPIGSMLPCHRPGAGVS